MVSLEWFEDPGWSFLRQPDHLLLKEQAGRRFDNKSHKWVADSAEGFVPAAVTVVEGKELTLRLPNNEKIKVLLDQTQSINPAKYDKAEDLATLVYLNEASILHTLRQRFGAILSYTYAGKHCIFINPYKQLPIYTESMAMMYLGLPPTEMPPHLFAVADEAYRKMIHGKFQKCNQALVITGESGSGKTENAARALFYYTMLGGDSDARQRKAVRFQDQVVRTFALLLEKSRVVKQFPQERSYHIFYQIISNRKICEICQLERDIKKYRFANQAEVRLHGIDDSDEFKRTDKALNSLGFSLEERHNVYQICAAILHLGQIRLKTDRTVQVVFDGDDAVQKLCRLLGIDRGKFTEALLREKLKERDGPQRSRTIDQVQSLISDLACTIYSLLFSWLISRFNKVLKRGAEHEFIFYIGILDIAGFEGYPYNTFERFWINLVNEKLQQYYNDYVFIMEQEEYRREQLHWLRIDFGHNLQPCLDLIQSPTGILAILNEESLKPNSNNDELLEKFDNSFSKNAHYCIVSSTQSFKKKAREFAIVHYAGEVRYSIDEWIEKNKSYIEDFLVQIFKSGDAGNICSKIWENYPNLSSPQAEAGREKLKPVVSVTLANVYSESLSRLVSELVNIQPHFLRCILPNEMKQSAVFDAGLVLNQLASNGILEGLRICRKGFSDRLLFAEFRHRYAILAPTEPNEIDEKKSVEALLKKILEKGKLKADQAEVGIKKVFFKYGVLRKMEKLREVAFSEVVVQLQSACRYYLARLYYLSLDRQRNAVEVIQQNVRSWTAMRKSDWLRLFFYVKPIIPLLRAKKQLEELRLKFTSIEQSRKNETDAKNLVEEQLRKQQEDWEKFRKAVEDDNVQLLKEKQDLLEQLASEKAKHLEVEDQKQLTCEENLKLKAEIETMKEQFVRRNEAELAQAKQLSETSKKNADEIGTEGAFEANKTKDTEEIAAKPEDLVEPGPAEKPETSMGGRDQAAEEIELLKKRCARLDARREEMQKNLDEYIRENESIKRGKEEIAKVKKKLESEVRQLCNQCEALKSEKRALEEKTKKSETELSGWKSRSNRDADLISKLQANTRKLIARIEDLELEIQDERRSRLRVEKQRDDLQEELNLLNERFYETNGQLNTQVQINKLRQMEKRVQV